MPKEIKKLLNSLTSYNCSWDNQSQYYLGEYDFGERAYFNVDWNIEVVEVLDLKGFTVKYVFSEFKLVAEELINRLKLEIKSNNLSLPKYKVRYNPYSLSDKEREIYNIIKTAY